MHPDASQLADERIFVDPEAYADPAAWHAAAERLRERAPLPYVEVPGFVPFRAVTRYAHVAEVERRHQLFHNTVDPVLIPVEETKQRRAMGIDLKTLVQMDGQEHRDHRRITDEWFKPPNLRRNIEAGLPALARRFVDRMVELGEECDFARDIALYYPLYVIMRILGVPEEDEPRMLRLTQQIFGSEDLALSGEANRAETFMAGLLDMAVYFQAITRDRRARPTDDVASAIANATIDGRPLGDIETAGYYTILATAGHDTTSSSLAGGLEALIRHPDQLRALQADPTGVANAVDEMIRWVTPVRHFLRQAQGDCVLADTQLRAGEWLLLSYLSANRDEDVFEEPFRFDVRRRNAGRHLAFGTGVHVCLGAHLARLEIQAFLRELLPRLEHIELAGEPTHLATTFVGGPKHLPIRYRIKKSPSS